nr:hypothetical protein [Paucibacter sp. M5-1]MCZ7883463.1 hypothetical protein [Paucibacter sp. M5-1]
MKLIGFWLLCLVAVLVPVTASIARSMMCPDAFVSKPQARQQKVDDVGHRQTLASAAGKHGSKPIASAKKVSDKVADTGSQSSEPCCDFSPCSHCIVHAPASPGSCWPVWSAAFFGRSTAPTCAVPCPN